MGIFLLFYKLLLEKESMHQFKRFFLLTAVIASFIIPQIVFTEYIEVEPTTVVTQVISINEPQEIQPVIQAIEKSPMNWSLILWTIYGLGVAGFALRFLINLYKIWKRIHNNPRTKHSAIYRILLIEQLPPHTFLRYIFLNKRKFEVNSIPNSVIKHEETHAKEWHSLDVLFIEILQVLFWFNPVIYAFKKSIKLNHEFLADSAVLNGQEDHLNYQNTILSYLSNDSFNTHQSVGIANAINYSSIKKRFIIMKKQTSKKGIAIRSLLLLPVLALMLYGFSQKNVIAQNTIKDINIEITKTGDLLLNNKPVALENLSTEVLRTNQNFGPYIIKNYLTAHILYDENQYGLIDQVQTELAAIGIFNIEHFSKRTANILGKHGFETSEYHGKTVDEAQKIRRNNVFNELKNNANQEPLLEIVWIEIKNEDEIWFNNQQVLLTELNEKIKSKFPLAIENNKLAAQIYATEIINSVFTDAITKELRKLKTKSITIFSDKYIMPKNEYEETVEITPETVILKTNDIILQSNKITKYNSLAKKYNAIPIEKRSIPLSDLRMLESIYKNMTVEERKSAQPFPECLPKQNQDGATKEQLSTYNKLAKSYNTMISEGGNIRILKADVDQLTYIYGLMSEKQKVNAEPFPDFPEPPPAPKAPNTSEYADSQINEIIENQDPYDHLNLDVKALNGIPSNTQTFHSKPSSPVAPPPPTPPSPLDYAISMAKKGATFFYEGKEVSSDKAIDLLKKNKALNIESKKKNGKTEVRISKELVTIR
ncbi:Signal transducer regulating beta-lactamase production, contains metallopeptidase domain [Maribacter litoralis]|uniref:Signal transducer regulating beta-lactamase production, contains metallopeptidase domain n=2 Tax=Maribacter litoralis TaxID=2059726 RepID=A0A653SLM8_9FLAO|nr:Signal transducer regulating beta-lactamase production, contains metallopeptidase domain [Maribacter litoralis]